MVNLQTISIVCVLVSAVLLAVALLVKKTRDSRAVLIILSLLLIASTCFAGKTLFTNTAAADLTEMSAAAEETVEPSETAVQTEGTGTEKTAQASETETAPENKDDPVLEESPAMSINAPSHSSSSGGQSTSPTSPSSSNPLYPWWWGTWQKKASPAIGAQSSVHRMKPLVNVTKKLSPASGKMATENAGSTGRKPVYLVLFIICAVLFAADLLAIRDVSAKIEARKRRRPTHDKGEKPQSIPKTQSVGKTATITAEPQPPRKQDSGSFGFAKVHNQGARTYQQDSHGMTPVMNGEGVFAIVADGMGGLSGGDQVSQQIIMQALSYMSTVPPEQAPVALQEMLSRINGAVNKMLGPNGLYKSGSTVVAVLVYKKQMRWISVGDSRIYLYREGWMNQLTRDHDLFQDWMPDILAGKRSFAEAIADPDGRKLTSFIGMGDLKHIDSSVTPIRILPGDRIVLMSDGIYNSVRDEVVGEILKKNSDVQKAAAALNDAVRMAANPHQDNYTAEILAF